MRTYQNNTIQPKSNLIEHDSFEKLMLNKESLYLIIFFSSSVIIVSNKLC
jgi:hypothetical protein